MVRRAVYERVGLFRTDLRLAGDFELLLRAFTAGERFEWRASIPFRQRREAERERPRVERAQLIVRDGRDALHPGRQLELLRAMHAPG